MSNQLNSSGTGVGRLITLAITYLRGLGSPKPSTTGGPCQISRRAPHGLCQLVDLGDDLPLRMNPRRGGRGARAGEVAGGGDHMAWTCSFGVPLLLRQTHRQLQFL